MRLPPGKPSLTVSSGCHLVARIPWPGHPVIVLGTPRVHFSVRRQTSGAPWAAGSPKHLTELSRKFQKHSPRLNFFEKSDPLPWVPKTGPTARLVPRKLHGGGGGGITAGTFCSCKSTDSPLIGKGLLQ